MSMARKMPHDTLASCSTAAAQPIAVGVMAYNEEDNIGHLLESLVHQSIAPRITSIVVMASGCTDRTCEIVAEWAKREPRIRLVAEAERNGKVAAINRFIKLASEPLCIITSADLAFHPKAVDRITEPFADPFVGVVGAHVVPVNTPDNFVGFTVNLMWSLHHDISLDKLKIGELCAFRNVIPALDPKTLNDEMSILYEIEKRGYRAAYAPDALIENCGPGNLRDFIKQRTRWIVANLSVEHEYKMSVSTRKSVAVLRATLAYVRQDWHRIHWFVAAAGVELWARLRARVEYSALRRHRKFQVWDRIATTKQIARTK